MGGGHVMQRDAEHVRDEMSGIGPGPSGRRDGVGTRRGMSHNSKASRPSPIKGISYILADPSGRGPGYIMF